jgi:hypothetical protein
MLERLTVIIKTFEMIKPFMDKAVEELKLNVVDECSYQFKKDNAPRCYNYLFDIRKSFVYSYICR